MNEINILKFGGASVATPFDFDQVAKIIQKKQQESKYIVVVVSAMAKTTDELISMAHLVHENPPKRELDMLVSVGERISISLLAMALHKLGIDAVSLTGSQSGVITSQNHNEALILDIRPQRVLKLLNEGKVVIVAGFQGVSLTGEITTLGRGGSDTSAVALAVSLRSPKVEFFKEVQGVYHKDPLKHADARFLETLDYDDMIDLCEKGAKVLHARSVKLAKKNSIVLEVKSFKDMSLPFTQIKSLKTELISERAVCFEASI
jgi:aspartate kinase